MVRSLPQAPASLAEPPPGSSCAAGRHHGAEPTGSACVEARPERRATRDCGVACHRWRSLLFSTSCFGPPGRQEARGRCRPSSVARPREWAPRSRPMSLAARLRAFVARARGVSLRSSRTPTRSPSGSLGSTTTVVRACAARDLGCRERRRSAILGVTTSVGPGSRRRDSHRQGRGDLGRHPPRPRRAPRRRRPARS